MGSESQATPDAHITKISHETKVQRWNWVKFAIKSFLLLERNMKFHQLCSKICQVCCQHEMEETK